MLETSKQERWASKDELRDAQSYFKETCFDARFPVILTNGVLRRSPYW